MSRPCDFVCTLEERCTGTAECRGYHAGTPSPAEMLERIAYLDKIVWGVVANEAQRIRAHGPLWSRLVRMCGIGSTTAYRLCEETGFDPETGAGQ